MNNDTEYAICNHCTYKLVAIAYQRTPWFRLFREPLKLGMRWLAILHRIDAKEYHMRTPECNQCIRFYKTALFPKSASFRWLHKQVNPVFNKLISKFVTDEEKKQAKKYAEAASEGTLSEEEVREWMKSMKATLWNNSQ
ncbi:nitroreductase [Chloroflexota bacterium]